MGGRPALLASRVERPVTKKEFWALVNAGKREMFGMVALRSSTKEQEGKELEELEKVKDKGG